MELNEKIKSIRKEKGYTQELLAEQLGVSRQAITKWESGKSYPSTENLIELSRVLDTDIKELIRDTKKPLLKRVVSRGNIVLYNDMLSYLNRDRDDAEEKYLISLMGNVECRLNCLCFVYGDKRITIALGKDKTEWVKLLSDIQNGIIPDAEDELNVEEYILNHYDEKHLVEAAKYYLSMNGGSRKNAVESVKTMLKAE